MGHSQTKSKSSMIALIAFNAQKLYARSIHGDIDEASTALGICMNSMVLEI